MVSKKDEKSSRSNESEDQCCIVRRCPVVPGEIGEKRLEKGRTLTCS